MRLPESPHVLYAFPMRLHNPEFPDDTQHPEVKPSLQRLDDGVATWLNRSAADTNRVVLLAAAGARLMLKGELGY